MVATAVFSGAGISGEAPASLPRGFGLRDDLLRLMHAVAAESLPTQVTGAQLDDLIGSARKLEVVLGRLSGMVGVRAAECLLSLCLRLPNEAHLLAALHLARGGVHVTLNFDVGIELAYQLLAGGAAAAAGLPADYRSALSAWQALMPAGARPVRVAAGRREFDEWLADGRPPALLKVHGSLSRDQERLVDVVVLDIDELGQLTPSRRAAVDQLGSAQELLITGYSGADPDVYWPLLTAAQKPSSSWCCYSLPDDSPVWEDVRSRRISLRTGAPAGLAVTALRDLLGLASVPAWPERSLGGSGYRERFDRWAEDFRARESADTIAAAWAWLLADGGDLDTAERMLDELGRRDDAVAGTIMRHAEFLYTRARGNDRDRAESLYRRVAGDRGTDFSTRLMCRLRRADISRGRAVRGGGTAVRHLTRAVTQPLLVLVATQAGRRGREPAADAYRALQQTALRVLERAAGSMPTWTWPVLAHLCRAARLLGGPAEQLAGNGNRRGLIRQHRLLLAAYASLLAGRQPPPHLVPETRSLRESYRSADDLPGSGNLTATLAVLAAAAGDLAHAHALLDDARTDYTAGRPDGIPIASGDALLNVVAQLLQRRSGQNRP